MATPRWNWVSGRIPRTTLHAWALHRDGRTFLGATPGGVNQLCWNLQVMLTLLTSDSLDVAVSAPRWGVGQQAGQWNVEADHPEASQGWGTVVPAQSLRSVVQIIAGTAGEATWRAAADPRLGATARASARPR